MRVRVRGEGRSALACHLIHVLAGVPWSRHVEKDDIVRKRTGWKRPIRLEPICGADDVVLVQCTTDDGVGKEIDGVTPRAPRLHDGRVRLFLPEKGDHAVHSITTVLGGSVV
jgi:hypothetical protein